MAARRLIIVMLVLLGVSTLAAALAPVDPGSESTTTSTRTAQTERDEHRGGQLVRETLDAQAEEPKEIRVPVGDQLSLHVESKHFGQVEIRGLGLLDDVTPLDPARFDILADERGRHEVRLLGQKEEVGVLEFAETARHAGENSQ
jgi:hypothetical protein